MKAVAIGILIAVFFAIISAAQTTFKPTTTVKTTLKSTTQKPTVLATTLMPTTFRTTTVNPTTSKKTTGPTTSLKTSTTLKTSTIMPTTSATSTKSTTNLMTTTKPTTSKTTVKSTTPVPSLLTFRLCVDTNSTTSNGTIQPYYNATAGAMSSCLFFIFSPSNNTARRVQISCSTLNISIRSSLTFYEAIEMANVSECNLGDVVANAPVVNTVYYSKSNKMAVMSQFGSINDLFSCQWTIV